VSCRIVKVLKSLRDENTTTDHRKEGKMLKRSFIIMFVACLLTVPFSISAAEKCLTCHEGIEEIADVPAMKALSCTFCHKGDPGAESLEAAHQGLLANPSDFRVNQAICGMCHAAEIDTLTKSLHATSAGVISGARYAQGAQGREGIYANYAVKDDKPGPAPAPGQPPAAGRKADLDSPEPPHR